MYANLKPFSVMGLPNKIASAETEAHAATTKRDFFIRSKQEALSEAGKSVVPALKIMISLPSRGGEEEDAGGCTTPKAADQRGGESDLPKCPPPPPRKPKSAPSTKRKAQRVLLDLTSEIDLLFPWNIQRDFMCGKIKKVRTAGCPQIL